MSWYPELAPVFSPIPNSNHFEPQGPKPSYQVDKSAELENMGLNHSNKMGHALPLWNNTEFDSLLKLHGVLLR